MWKPQSALSTCAPCQSHPLKAELACLVLHFTSEDLTQFEVQAGGSWGAYVPHVHFNLLLGLRMVRRLPVRWRVHAENGENKRLFLAALTNSVPVVFPFLCEVRMVRKERTP